MNATGAHHRGWHSLSHVSVLHERGKDERQQLAAIKSQHDVLHGHGALQFKVRFSPQTRQSKKSSSGAKEC